MAYKKTILCLANSRRPGGRCVAGKEIDGQGFGEWIRPVSTGDSEAISAKDRCNEDGRDPSVLDIIEIDMLKPRPHAHQTENHLINDKIYWREIGRLGWNEVTTALDTIQGPLWANGHSTWNGRNDKVPEAIASGLPCSLYLVRPDRLSIEVAEEGGAFGAPKRRVRASFSFNDASYKFVVTDYAVDRRYRAGKDGSFAVDDAILCVSLSASWKGNAYKLVAAVITPDMGAE